MTRSTLAIFLGLVLLLVLVFAGFVWLRGVDETPSVQSRDIVTERLTPDATENIDLYFPGQNHALYRESREVPATRSRIALLRQVVEGVLAGPTGAGLFPPLPAGVRLVGVHLNDAGIAYIDLAMENLAARPSWGSKRELLAAFSLVNSIQLNLPETTSVVLLWNGIQRPTFAGHVDTRHGLITNRRLVAATAR